MKRVEKIKRIDDQVIGNQGQIELDFRFSQSSNFIVEIEVVEHKCVCKYWNCWNQCNYSNKLI